MSEEIALPSGVESWKCHCRSIFSSKCLLWPAKPTHVTQKKNVCFGVLFFVGLIFVLSVKTSDCSSLHTFWSLKVSRFIFKARSSGSFFHISFFNGLISYFTCFKLCTSTYSAWPLLGLLSSEPSAFSPSVPCGCGRLCYCSYHLLPLSVRLYLSALTK